MELKKLDLSGITVGIVDERGEISAMNKGIAENNIGIRTDILNNVRKDIGIGMLIRSMAPKVIISDEIGNIKDISAINYCLCSGVKGIFTAHGTSINYLKANPIFNEMLNMKLFEKIIFLKQDRKGEIESVYEEEFLF